ncbi:MAG: hypothetical protein HRT35_08100 [Algicola sp.]|nr:hypothetical protein [Algicola sp.]
MKRPPILDALPLYWLATAKNQLGQAVRALKMPRNLLAMALTLGVSLWLFNILPENVFSKVFNGVLGKPYIFFLAMLLELMLKFLFSGGLNCFAQGLRFSQPEIELFFSSPISRRQMVLFKLLNVFKQGMIIAIPASIISTIIFEQQSFLWLLPGLIVTFGVSITLYAIARYAISYMAMIKLQWVSWLVISGVIIAIGYAGVQIFVQSQELFKDLSKYQQTPAFSSIAKVFDWLVTPAFSTSWAEFLNAIWLPLLIWIASSLVFFTRKFPYAFFEQSISGAGTNTSQSKDLLARKDATNSSRITPKLAPIGSQYRALVWKTVMASAPLRSRKVRWLLGALLLLLPVASLFPFPLGLQYILRVILITLIMTMVFIGPWLLRGGLRHDMPYMDLLKSMPIDGRQLMFGTMLVPISITFAIVCLASVCLGLIATDLYSDEVPSANYIITSVIGLPMLFALIAARFTIHNMWALYLPSFVSYGVNTGGELLQLSFRAVVSAVALAILMVVPIYTLRWIFSNGESILPLAADGVKLLGTTSACIILLCELLLLIYLSQSRYQHFDISQENTGG